MTASAPVQTAIPTAMEPPGRDLERPTFLRKLNAKRDVGLVADNEGLLRFVQVNAE